MCDLVCKLEDICLGNEGCWEGVGSREEKKGERVMSWVGLRRRGREEKIESLVSK